jgi:SAM-dependent methyltransferase
MTLRDSITRWKPRLRTVPGYRLARFFFNLFHGTESRNAALLLLWPPKGLFQPYGTTSFDRYPVIFDFVRNQIGDGNDVRILSVGCSTGEEVFSLRRYFPRAAIVGLDINPLNVVVCRFRKLRRGDRRMHFAVASSTAGEPDSSYDAVFAMAVFRHGDLNVVPPPPVCDHRIRFEAFARSVDDLARIVKPRGLLVMQHAMFRFSDTRVASQFETALSLQPDEPGPIYGSDNCLLKGVNDSGVVFRKLP